MLIDTNTIVRFVTRDPEKQFLQVEVVLKDAAEGKIRLHLLPMVLAESVYVLHSFYELSRIDISNALIAFVSSAEIVTDDPKVLTAALDFFGKTKLDFVDCYLAANGLVHSAQVLSFDKDFGKVNGLDWINPSTYKRQ